MTISPEMQPARTLLLFDGYNIVRRVYGAVPGDDSPEKVEGAFKSALSTFRRTLVEFPPTHVLATFDFGGRTFRSDIFSSYREHRKPMPELLREAMPVFHRMLSTLGIPVVSVEGVEADDVLATVGMKWVNSNKGRVIVVSTDKDLAQLAPSGIEIRDQFEHRWLDNEWALKKFGVPIELVGDCLALMGDVADSIPGIPKCGVKTAAKWLIAYKDLDGVLAHKDEIGGQIGEHLRENVETALLARKLVTLKTDVKLDLTWNQLVFPVQA